MTLIEVYTGDQNYDLNFTVNDSNGNPIDLTGASLVFKAQKQEAAALKFSGSMNVTSPIVGACKYTVQATDFDEAGDYYAEIEASFAGGKKLTFGNVVVKVIQELPKP